MKTSGRLEPELEREIYAAFRRYLQHLPDAALDERYLSIRRHLRAAEIAANADLPRWELPFGNLHGPAFWLRKDLLTAEEFRLRGRALPPGPPPRSPRLRPERPASLAGKRPGGEDFLVRFSDERHLRPMLERGALRLSPAAALLAAENNAARRDDELHKHRLYPGEHVRIEDPRTGQPIPAIGEVRFTRQAPPYYFLCLSNDFAPELFEDFGVDACLIIHDPAALAARLGAATAPLLPGWIHGHFNVEYYDPYELQENQVVDAAASKDIFFTSQKEYRFCWMPPRGAAGANAHLPVEVGPLSDIAELYVPPAA